MDIVLGCVVGALLALLSGEMYKILKHQEQLMASLADLETAITALSTEVTTLQTDVAAFIAAGATIPQSTVDQITALTTTLQGIDASVKA